MLWCVAYVAASVDRSCLPVTGNPLVQTTHPTAITNVICNWARTGPLLLCYVCQLVVVENHVRDSK